MPFSTPKSKNVIKVIILISLILLVSMLLVSCGNSASKEESLQATIQALQTEVAAATSVAEAVTATAVAVPTDTPTNIPTDTATPTKTPKPTKTPTPTKRKPTTTPRPTNTPRPTRTPTPRPSIGTPVRCGNYWEITVLGAPTFAKRINVLNTLGYLTISDTDLAKGEWMFVRYKLTNLQSETDSLSSWGDDLVVRGELNKRTVTFTPSDWGTSSYERRHGISNWTDEVPPGITIETVTIFDVNPDAKNLRLVLQPEKGFGDRLCRAVVFLESSEISSDKPSVTATNNVNIRKGPGTNYPVVGKARKGQQFEVVGKNANGSWWQIMYNGSKAWIADSVVKTSGPIDDIAVATDIPAPPATPTPLPRVRPDQEFVVGKWGIKLYDVKKAKTVYWYSEAVVANGIWLTPLVELRNLGSGTASPLDSLTFYLQDAQGKRYKFDPFNDAVLATARQYQTGKLYGDINPGIVIGTSLPFDVPANLGDVWLRVTQAPSVVIYLGNVSQIPSEN